MTDGTELPFELPEGFTSERDNDGTWKLYLTHGSEKYHVADITGNGDLFDIVILDKYTDVNGYVICQMLGSVTPPMSGRPEGTGWV